MSPLMFTVILLITTVFLCGWWFSRRYVKRTYRTHPPVGKFVGVAGVNLHYIEAGAGRTVVMIHGSDGTLFNFKRSIFDLVAQQFHAVAFDRPGHGYSQTPKGEPLTIALNARMIRQAVQTLGVERPIVVGYSYGGAVALRWAIDHPEDIGGLVLISPAAFPERHLLAGFAYLAGVPILGPLLVQTLFVPIALPQTRIWARRAFRPDPLPPNILDSVKAFSLRPKQFAAFAEEMRHFNRELADIGSRAHSIRIPVAIIAGDGDILLAVSRQAKRLADAVPQATLRVFPDTGHEVHHKYPSEVLDAIGAVARQIKE